MTVRQLNVSTGKVTERPYTQKELDGIALNKVEGDKADAEQTKKDEKDNAREEAIEELLQTSTGAKATAYKKL